MNNQHFLPQKNLKPYEVTDPSDWTTTRLPILKSLDSALRCQICKDYYDTPVITNCCHTFCSRCIRRTLVSEQKCPVCRAGAQESQLRKNGVAQELVEAFVRARPVLIEVAKEKEKGSPDGTGGEEEGEVEGEVETDIEVGVRRSARRKRERDITPTMVDNSAVSGNGARRITRNSSKFGYNPPSSLPSSQGQVIDLDGDDGDEYKPPQSPALVACPICEQFMKEMKVDSHIENGCPRESPVSPRKRLRGNNSLFNTKAQFSTPSISSAPPSPTDLRPLPKITFGLMKESTLRNKLQDLGIPISGNKKMLQDRYNEWLTLWNANVDSTTPRSKRELLGELHAWDAANRIPVVEKTKAPGWTDQGWLRANKSQFDELIEKARGKGDGKRGVPGEQKQGKGEEVARVDGVPASPTLLTVSDNENPQEDMPAFFYSTPTHPELVYPSTVPQLPGTMGNIPIRTTTEDTSLMGPYGKRRFEEMGNNKDNFQSRVTGLP